MGLAADGWIGFCPVWRWINLESLVDVHPNGDRTDNIS